MMCPKDTRIAYVGGAFSAAAVDAAVKLADAGFSVVAGPHDPREAALLMDAGIPCMRSLAEAVEGRQIILTSCAHGSEVEELYLGEAGLLGLMEPGTIAIDLSFAPPQLSREIQAMAAISDLIYIDAPLVSMGEDEQSVAFVGGEPSAIEEISPLLPYLADVIHPQEAPGDGQTAAMVAYIGLAGSIMGMIEAIQVGRISNYSTKGILDALASTSAASRALVDYGPRTLDFDFSGKIKVGEFLDFLDTALAVAESLGVTTPMLETAYQLYELLTTVGGEAMSIQALALLYEEEQTCADYGLDWALAEGMDYPDVPEPGDEYYGGPMDPGDNYLGGGPLGFGGPTSASGFFSKN